MLSIGSIVIRVDDLQRRKKPPDTDYVILADPEGNRFCVIDTG